MARGDWLAIVAVAIVFRLLVSAGYAVLAALMGIYLGWLFLATGNLAVPIVTHGVYDFLALVYILNHAGKILQSRSLSAIFLSARLWVRTTALTVWPGVLPTGGVKQCGNHGREPIGIRDTAQCDFDLRVCITETPPAQQKEVL